MLSRHLYRIDEVLACYRYSLLKRLHSEAAFWALECIDTWNAMDMFQSLLYVYFYGIGVNNLQILSDILEVLEKDEIDMEEGLRLTHGICNTQKRDIAVFYLLCMGLTEKQPDTLSYKKTGSVDDPILEALQQKKCVLAWYFLRSQWSKDENGCWGKLLNCMDEKTAALFQRVKENEFVKEHFLWESRALALLACTEHISWTPVHYEISPILTTQIEEWKKCEGRRKRRAFKIRIEAIQYGVKRANEPSQQSNLNEIREPFRYLRGSPFWEGVLEDMGGKWNGILRNDDVKEAFFDLYFPDDIPDEWSKEDQEKSHTYGLRVSTATDEIQEKKHIRNLFSAFPSRGLASWTVEALAKYPYGKGFQQTYSEIDNNEENLDTRKKVKKIRVPE